MAISPALITTLNHFSLRMLSLNQCPLNQKKRCACEVLQAAYWAKRQYGRVVNGLLDLYHGDFEKVVSSLVRDDSQLSFTSMHQKLINSL